MITFVLWITIESFLTTTAYRWKTYARKTGGVQGWRRNVSISSGIFTTITETSRCVAWPESMIEVQETFVFALPRFGRVSVFKSIIETKKTTYLH